jgi:hypothetical protein
MGKWSRDQERPLELQGTEGVAGRLALWRRGFERIAQQPISISTVLCLHPLASTRIHLIRKDWKEPRSTVEEEASDYFS